MFLAAAAIPAGATAATATPGQQPEDWKPTYDRLITELMSPYCHGLTLADCPTQGARDLRDEIRGWLALGRDEEWILDELELRFGPSILGSPRMRGIGLLAWFGPAVFFLAGVAGVVLFLRRRTVASSGKRSGSAGGDETSAAAAGTDGAASPLRGLSPEDAARVARIETESTRLW